MKTLRITFLLAAASTLLWSCAGTPFSTGSSNQLSTAQMNAAVANATVTASDVCQLFPLGCFESDFTVTGVNFGGAAFQATLVELYSDAARTNLVASSNFVNTCPHIAINSPVNFTYHEWPIHTPGNYWLRIVYDVNGTGNICEPPAFTINLSTTDANPVFQAHYKTPLEVENDHHAATTAFRNNDPITVDVSQSTDLASFWLEVTPTNKSGTPTGPTQTGGLHNFMPNIPITQYIDLRAMFTNIQNPTGSPGNSPAVATNYYRVRMIAQGCSNVNITAEEIIAISDLWRAAEVNEPVNL